MDASATGDPGAGVTSSRGISANARSRTDEHSPPRSREASARNVTWIVHAECVNVVAARQIDRGAPSVPDIVASTTIASRNDGVVETAFRASFWVFWCSGVMESTMGSIDSRATKGKVGGTNNGPNASYCRR